ncbi:MAG: hypothetical protein K6E79_07875 [Pseudobutyrivibrio sp.]|nr:hypothetical protein [Pseudobutyrivibrio sp.]
MTRRRPKKKRRQKTGLVLVIIEIILGIAILVGILGGLAYFLCPLQSVKVEGTDLYTDEEITGYILDDEYSVNTVYVYIKNKLFPKGDAEFIDSFDVSMTGLNSITIHCKEKSILGYMEAEDGNYIYFNYNGVIAEISASYVEGYMKVEGVTCEDPKVGDTLSIGADEVGYLTSLIKLLQKNSLMPNVISYDEKGYVTLKYDTYDISLGGSYYLEEKIDRIVYLLPNIEGMSGTLHLENFSTTNTDIVFEKSDSAE